MNKKNDDLVGRLWTFFSSMRFGIMLILVLSGVLALTTIWAPISGTSNIYHAPWFLLIIGLLCMNSIICTINRIHILINSIFPKPSFVKKKNIGNLPFNYRSVTTTDTTALEQHVSRFFRSRHYKVRQVKEEEVSYFYVTRGILASWCSLLLHLSLVIIVAGVLWGGMVKFETNVTIPEGYTSDLSMVKQLDPQFRIRLDKFNTLYDEQGNVSNWVSMVSILSPEGTVMDRGEVKVNHPLNYQGVNLYQHSYGQALKLLVMDERNGDSQSIVLSQEQYYHQLSQLGGIGLWVGRYQDGQVPYQFNDGTSGVLRQGDSVKLPGEVNKHLRLEGTIPFSVIQVKKDPSVPVVFTGLILMAISFFGTTLIPRRCYWAKIQTGGDGKAELIVGGIKQGRDYDGEREFQKLTGALKSILDKRGDE